MYYKDEYEKNFQREVELHEHLAELDERSWWKRIPCREIEVLTVGEDGKGLTPVDGVAAEELLLDTGNHTGLLVKAFDEVYALGSTALPTLQRRARISGSALSEW